MCVGTTTDGIEHRPGTIGKLYLGPEWLIVDDNLKEVKYNEPGELIVASDTLCKGYYNDREETKKCFIRRNGKIYYRSGDIVSLDTDGYITFYDRKRRIYNVNVDGIFVKVNCEAIEQALERLNLVKKAAVIIKTYDGAKDSKAFVELNPTTGSADHQAAIRQELANELHYYQMPREIAIIDEMPIMGSGKINYKKLSTLD